jgi:hypothetical protein
MFFKNMRGGKLKSTTLQGLLNASYDKKVKKVDDFQQDRELSTKTSKVYVNPDTGQTVVAHKGTSGILDWGNNAVFALTGVEGYKQTPRFKEAEKVQKKAEKKYGDKNITTIGHSQGGLQAELLGKNTKEIITLNKATRPFGNRTSKNQYDIKTEGDLVSALNPFQNQKNVSKIETDLNPLDAHAIETLSLVDTEYGKGMKLGINNVTSSIYIDSVCKNIRGYHGCFIKDELPTKLERGYYVINLNGQSHWTCLCIDDDSYYFDSFGFVAPTEVEKKIGKYYWNNGQVQDIDSSACGYYVISFIKHMNGKRHKLKAFEDFLKLFSKDSKDNDMILKMLMQ